jgi:very-short-patch-repair endonuclease
MSRSREGRSRNHPELRSQRLPESQSVDPGSSRRDPGVLGTGVLLPQPADHPSTCFPRDAIAWLAKGQHGVVTREQLLRAGVSRRTVDRCLKVNWLQTAYRGVYFVGPLLTPRSREMAAVLACGAGAAVSHMSAASLWGLMTSGGGSDPVHVTVPDRGVYGKRGLVCHRSRWLEADQVSSVDGIPVTAPARTILDLSTCVGPRRLEQALAQAERRQLVTLEELRALVHRRPGRAGTPALRDLLQHHGSPALTRSEAEERFLALIRRGKLPTPEANVLLGGHELDFLWRSEGIAVEVDGFAFHSSRSQFERDRRRDAELLAGGIQVIRVTWRQIETEPYAVLACLAQALARAGLRTR